MRAALRALALALLAAPAAAQQPAADPQAIAHLFPPLVQAMNAERTARGLPPLAENTALANAAGHHAQDMARRGYLAHASPDGRATGSAQRASTGASRPRTSPSRRRMPPRPSPPGWGARGTARIS